MYVSDVSVMLVNTSKEHGVRLTYAHTLIDTHLIRQHLIDEKEEINNFSLPEAPRLKQNRQPLVARQPGGL